MYTTFFLNVVDLKQSNRAASWLCGPQGRSLGLPETPLSQ